MNAMRNQRIMELHKQGMNQSEIAREMGIGRMSVRYAIDPEYRARLKLRDQSKKRPVATSTIGPVYDGGSVWIEDRSVWSCGPSKRNGYKCAGKGGKQEPKPVKPKPVPVGIIAATKAYLDGGYDRDALAAYLVSVGRDSLAIGSVAE